MKGKQATVHKMHHSGMHCPLCVYFCNVLLSILVTWSLEQRLSLYVVCAMPDLQPCAVVMPKIGKVAECGAAMGTARYVSAVR